MNNPLPVACARWAEKLAATHPGDLSASERAALTKHMQTCEACAAVFADYRAMDAHILQLPSVEPLAGLQLDLASRRGGRGEDVGMGRVRRPWRVGGGNAAMPQHAGDASVPSLPSPTPAPTRASSALPRKRRLANVASSLVVVLVVVGVIGSFLLLWANHGTLGGHPSLVPVQTTHAYAQIFAVNCPANQVARAAVMPTLTLGNHNTLVYVDNEASGGFLKRYDTVTRQSSDILYLPGTAIADAQLSANGQWVLFASAVGASGDANYPGSGATMLQLVRVDGKYQQTLYCLNQAYGNFLWSPDMRTLLFADGGPSPATLYMLDLLRGKVQPILQYTETNVYSPMEWRDNSHAYLYDSPGNLYVLDTTKGANQTSSDLQLVKRAWPGSFDQCLDGTQLYFSTYTGGPKAHFGPSEITLQTLADGSTRTVYRSKTQAVDNLNVFSNRGLVFIVDTYAPYGGDSSSIGLWTISTDGTGLKHLVTQALAPSLNLFSNDPWSNVSRDGQFYALKIETEYKDTLVVGSMSGEAYTTIDARSQEGWTHSGAVGWTTM